MISCPYLADSTVCLRRSFTRNWWRKVFSLSITYQNRHAEPAQEDPPVVVPVHARLLRLVQVVFLKSLFVLFLLFSSLLVLGTGSCSAAGSSPARSSPAPGTPPGCRGTSPRRWPPRARARRQPSWLHLEMWKVCSRFLCCNRAKKQF